MMTEETERYLGPACRVRLLAMADQHTRRRSGQRAKAARHRTRGNTCRTACSSQCDQKTDLMEETRQYIYTSTLPLTCGFLRPKHGPKLAAISLFNIAPAGS
jgi:hypothetical protein